MPSAENTFRNLCLNQRVSVVSPFISRDVWQSCGGAVLDFGDSPVWAGLDLSGRTDLTALVLVVSASAPYKDLNALIAAAKAKPKTVSSASAGQGTSQHMTLELLGFRTGSQFIHVPYKGSGPAIQDVIGGQVDMMFDTTVVAGPHIQIGRAHV